MHSKSWILLAQKPNSLKLLGAVPPKPPAGDPDQPIMLLFLPIMLRYSALKFTHHAQYYAQEQDLLSDYYGIYMHTIL